MKQPKQPSTLDVAMYLRNRISMLRAIRNPRIEDIRQLRTCLQRLNEHSRQCARVSTKHAIIMGVIVGILSKVIGV